MHSFADLLAEGVLRAESEFFVGLHARDDLARLLPDDLHARLQVRQLRRGVVGRVVALAVRRLVILPVQRKQLQPALTNALSHRIVSHATAERGLRLGSGLTAHLRKVQGDCPTATPPLVLVFADAVGARETSLLANRWILLAAEVRLEVYFLGAAQKATNPLKPTASCALF